MTIKEILNNAGLANHKSPFERFQHSSPSGQGYYGGHEQFFPQKPIFHAPPPKHVYNHYTHSTVSGGHKGGGTALSALTLLSFLFFLSILQQCLRDQMNSMTPQVMVMTAGREELKEGKQGDTDLLESKKTSDGIGRANPMEIVEKPTFEDTGREHVDVTSYPVYVDAMGDGIGEIIEQ